MFADARGQGSVMLRVCELLLTQKWTISIDIGSTVAYADGKRTLPEQLEPSWPWAAAAETTEKNQNPEAETTATEDDPHLSCKRQKNDQQVFEGLAWK